MYDGELGVGGVEMDSNRSEEAANMGNPSATPPDCRHIFSVQPDKNLAKNQKSVKTAETGTGAPRCRQSLCQLVRRMGASRELEAAAQLPSGPLGPSLARSGRPQAKFWHTNKGSSSGCS